MENIKAFYTQLMTIYEGKPPVSKARMALITKSALKYVKYYKHIVLAVEKFIHKAPPEYKLGALYVIDSIVRQSAHQHGKKDIFAPRFSKNLYETFKSIFKCVPEDKSKVIRVLNLWQKNGTFSTNIIQSILDLANPKFNEIVFENLKNETNNQKECAEEALKVVTDLLAKCGKDPASIGINPQHYKQLEIIGEYLKQQIDLSKQSSNEGVALSVDAKVVTQLKELAAQLFGRVNQNMNKSKEENTELIPGFNKKILDFDYSDDEEEEAQNNIKKNEADIAQATQNILSNPDIMKQIQKHVISQIQSVGNAESSIIIKDQDTIKKHILEQQQEEFDKQIKEFMNNKTNNSTAIPGFSPSPTKKTLQPPPPPPPSTNLLAAPPFFNSFVSGGPGDGRQEMGLLNSQQSANFMTYPIGQIPPPFSSFPPNIPGPPAALLPDNISKNSSTFGYQPEPFNANNIQANLNGFSFQDTDNRFLEQNNITVSNIDYDNSFNNNQNQHHQQHPKPQTDVRGAGEKSTRGRRSDSIEVIDNNKRDTGEGGGGGKTSKTSSRHHHQHHQSSRNCRHTNHDNDSGSNAKSNDKETHRRRHDSRDRDRNKSRSNSKSDHKNKNYKGKSSGSSRRDNSPGTHSSKRKDRDDDTSRRDNSNSRNSSAPVFEDKQAYVKILSRTVWIGHVPKNATQDDLKEAFQKYRLQYESIKMVPPRGCAYVCFSTRNDAQRALAEMKDRYRLLGKTLQMDWSPFKGLMDNDNYKLYWNISKGAYLIPPDKINVAEDSEKFNQGGTVDWDTVPYTLRCEIETIMNNSNMLVSAAIKEDDDIANSNVELDHNTSFGQGSLHSLQFATPQQQTSQFSSRAGSATQLIHLPPGGILLPPNRPATTILPIPSLTSAFPPPPPPFPPPPNFNIPPPGFHGQLDVPVVAGGMRPLMISTSLTQPPTPFNPRMPPPCLTNVMGGPGGGAFFPPGFGGPPSNPAAGHYLMMQPPHHHPLQQQQRFQAPPGFRMPLTPQIPTPTLPFNTDNNNRNNNEMGNRYHNPQQHRFFPPTQQFAPIPRFPPYKTPTPTNLSEDAKAQQMDQDDLMKGEDNRSSARSYNRNHEAKHTFRAPSPRGKRKDEGRYNDDSYDRERRESSRSRRRRRSPSSSPNHRRRMWEKKRSPPSLNNKRDREKRGANFEGESKLTVAASSSSPPSNNNTLESTSIEKAEDLNIVSSSPVDQLTLDLAAASGRNCTFDNTMSILRKLDPSYISSKSHHPHVTPSPPPTTTILHEDIFRENSTPPPPVVAVDGTQNENLPLIPEDEDSNFIKDVIINNDEKEISTSCTTVQENSPNLMTQEEDVDVDVEKDIMKGD